MDAEIQNSQKSTPKLLIEDNQILNDLHHIEQKLSMGVRSSTRLPQELSERLIQLGGKRIRPLLLCMVYRSLEQKYTIKPRATRDDLYTLASVSELVHTATLFHDDVLDFSEERRGAPSAHVLYGNKISILVGDFVYAEAFAQLMERALLEPSQKLARTIKQLVEGELLQHEMTMSRSLLWQDFLNVARAKTASLFSWCCEIGAWASGLDYNEIAFDFGQNLGLAFQFADDILDTYNLKELEENPEKVNEWIDAAPPLPVVLAAQVKNNECVELWNRLKTDGKKISQEEALKVVQNLMAICSEPEIIEKCEHAVIRYIASAEKGLEYLGGSSELEQAVEIIKYRAQKGLAYGRELKQ